MSWFLAGPLAHPDRKRREKPSCRQQKHTLALQAAKKFLGHKCLVSNFFEDKSKKRKDN
jgi:hypothetical protein